jgi:hypothetical protein
MAIDSSVQGKIAFKNLAGKSQTTDNLELNGEAYGISFEVQAKDVTIDRISSTSSITIQNGLAIRVRADLVQEASAGTKGYLAKWPSTLTGNILLQPPGGDPNNGLQPFEYGKGSLKDVKAGDRITNLISNSISGDYRAILRGSGLDEIPPLDAGDWLFQYNSGILYVDKPTSISYTPTYIDVYYYIGTRLTDFSTKTQTNIRISATGSDSYFATYSSPSIDAYQSNYIFLVDFFGYNTGATVTLNINSIGTLSVYKPSSSGPMPLTNGDIIGATGGTGGPIYYLTYNQGGKYFEFFYTNPVAMSGNFTNPVSTNYNVGGIQSGYSFNDVKIVDMLKDIFYPESMGRIGTFSMTSEGVQVSKSYEIGQTISGGLYYTFSWVFDNQGDLKDKTLRIEDVTPVTQTQTYWQPPSATPFTQSTGLTGPMGFFFANSIKSNVPAKRVFRLSVERSNGTRVHKDYEIDWMWRVYHGSSTFSTLTASQVRDLSNKTLSKQSSGTWSLPGDGFKYIAFPEDSDYNFQNITYKNLPLAMAGTNSGYSYSFADLNYLFVTVSNAFGLEKQYKIYRTKNEINATFSVNIS